MRPDILAVVLANLGAWVITLISRKWLVKLRFGAAGILLILLPPALAVARDLSPEVILVFAVIGIFLLLADVGTRAPNRR